MKANTADVKASFFELNGHVCNIFNWSIYFPLSAAAASDLWPDSTQSRQALFKNSPEISDASGMVRLELICLLDKSVRTSTAME